MRNLIVFLTCFLSSVALADLTPGGSGSPADMPSGLTIAGGDALTSYQTDTYAADGDLTSGNFIAIKEGNKVTIMCDSTISHGSFSAPQSAVGLIGAAYRPSTTAANVYDASASRVMIMRVQSDGRVRFEYYDWTGSGVTNTNTNTRCSVTYYVN